MDLDIEVVDDASQVTEALRTAWRDLAATSSLPYADPDWMLGFWTGMHASGGQLAVVVVRDGATVVGIGPFYGAVHRSRFDCPELLVLGAGAGQRTAPLALPGAEADVARALASVLADREPALSMVSFPAIDAASAWPEAMAAGWPGLRPQVRVDSTAAAPVVVMGDSFASWRAARSRHFRASLNRTRRDFERRGGTTRRSAAPAEVESDLAALFALHQLRFSEQGRATGLDQYSAAVAAAAGRMVATGAARLWVAEGEGAVVGAQLHVVAGGRMCFWNGGFDPGWQQERPGFVLLEEAVRDAHELGARVLDMGAGAGAYKLRFADADEPLAWTALLARNRRYPLLRARLAPAHGRVALRRGFERLPDDLQDRVKSVRRMRGGD